jgi:hypothetical protein
MCLFDSVYVPCPDCGKQYEFQSKAGGPHLNSYTLDDAPGVILADLNGATARCDCGTTFGIYTNIQVSVWADDCD